MEGRRIMIKGPMDLEVQRFEVDPEPGEGRVLVKNRYTAISAGTELSIYTGTNPRVYEPGSWCNYPHVPGYAGIGEVIAVGPGVGSLKVGDYVFHHPHHASHDVLDSRYGLFAKVPKELYLPEVALARFAAIVLSGSVRLTRVELGDKMALFGLGIIGQTAAQLFSLAGADVIAFDPSRTGGDLRRRWAPAWGCTIPPPRARRAWYPDTSRRGPT